MPTINFRIDPALKDKIEKRAKKYHETASQYLRRLVEEELATTPESAEQNQQAVTAGSPTNPIAIIDAQKKPEFLVEYKKNLEYFAVEVSALLHAIIQDSGKFTPDEAAKLEQKAQQQTNLYMKHYEKGEVKRGE